MGRSATAAVISSFFVLLGASSAQGQRTLPPDSAVDQYIEGLPGAGGERSARDARGAGGRAGARAGGSPGSLDQATVAALEAAGPDGAAAAALAQGSTPTGAERRRAARLADADAGRDGDRGSAVGGTVEALTGSEGGGMGPALPIILGLAAIAAIGVALARRRGSGLVD